MDHSAQSSLVLDDDVWDTHLAAEGRDEDNELDGVDIISKDDQAGLLRPSERNQLEWEKKV